jgi:diguanylate cyclase (GGDEF)-like protein
MSAEPTLLASDTRSGRLGPAATVATGMLVLAAVLWCIELGAAMTGRLDPTQFRLISVAAITAAAAADTALVLLVRRSGLGRRRALSLMACAFGLIALAGAASALSLLRGGTTLVPPGLHDVVFLAGALIVFVAMVRHPDLGPPSQRTRVIIDSAITALSVVVVLWLLGGRSLVDQGHGVTASMVVVVTAAAVLSATRGSLVLATSALRDENARRVASAITVGFAWLGVGAVTHLLTHLWYSTALALFGDLAVLVGFGVIGATGVATLRGSRLPRLARSGRRLRWVLDLTPILASAVATTALLIDAAQRGRFDATAAGVLTVVVSSVLLRQSVTLSDNRELSSSLRITVDDMERQATHDALTGLPNRIGLHERITEAAERAQDSGRCCAVYFVDVDHLKSINDTLGHVAGDLLLQVTADRLRARVGDRVTRFGGDEFVVVVDDLVGPRRAEQLGRELVDDTGQTMTLDGARIRSSTSLGLTLVEPGTTPEEVLRRADVALYHAKSLGRRCAAAYDAAEDTSMDVALDLGPDLQRAVRADEFELWYQPIVELDTGRAVSVEALLRWQHPVRGVLTPDVFLAAAIDAGLLGAIGATSLRRACRDFATSFPGEDGPSVAVNLSSSELADRRAVSRVSLALAESGLPPQRLTLEITEDVIIDDTVRSVTERLSALGVHLAIDDFGTGNSSLRQLGAYPADVLKIDRSFVRHLEQDERARAVTAAIVRLAGQMGLVTLAEGVETEGQARLLAGMGCARAQGWLFARAMPLEELTRWWGEHTPVAYRDRRASAASASPMMRSSSSATGGRSSIAPTT